MPQGYKKGGWRRKYFISKTILNDSGSITGLRWVDEEAQYFVLRFDQDPHARIAMRAYAKSVEIDNPRFAADILDKLEGSDNTKGAVLEKIEMMDNPACLDFT